MDTPPAQRPFPFFDLPRELRDHIYSYLHHDHKDVVGRAGHTNEPRVSLRCCPLASAPLVCSQFAHEYKDAKKKQVTMVFDDHRQFHPVTRENLELALRKVRPLLHGTLQNVRFAEFNLTGGLFVNSWSHGKAKLQLWNYSQATWITEVTRTLERLQSFQIRYSLTSWTETPLRSKWSDKVILMTTLKRITDLIAIPRLSELELFAASGIPECSEFDVVDHELNEKSSIAIWTPGGLWRCKGEESAFEVTSGSCGKDYCYECA